VPRGVACQVTRSYGQVATYVTPRVRATGPHASQLVAENFVVLREVDAEVEPMRSFECTLRTAIDYTLNVRRGHG